jgi:hypothetical protein
MLSAAARRMTGSVAALISLAFLAAPPAMAQKAPAKDPPFAALIGWWNGEGKLGFKDGQTEVVKCRATYLAGDAGKLDQTIRCAAASGAIEVRASVAEAEGKLTGTWVERVHNLSGDIAGEVTPRGFRVRVSGSQMTAGMDIMVRGERQIVEIHFYDSTLVGLTLLLQKGTAARPPS